MSFSIEETRKARIEDTDDSVSVDCFGNVTLEISGEGAMNLDAGKDTPEYLKALSEALAIAADWRREI